MDQPRTHIDHPVLRDIPLPGLFKCLSWQLNVTTYPKQGAIKLVSVIREPQDQIEVQREFINPTQIADIGDAAMRSRILQGWVDLHYLSGWRDS